MHIVLKWIPPCLCSNTRFLLDSAFAGIYGNECHSLSLSHTLTHTHTRTHRHTDTHMHAHTDTHEECWYSCLSAAALQTASRGSALRLITSLPLLKSPSHLLPLSSSFHLPIHPSIHPSIHPFLPPLSHIVSLALLSSLVLSVLLSVPQTTWLPSKMWLKRMISSLSSLLPSSLPLPPPPFLNVSLPFVWPCVMFLETVEGNKWKQQMQRHSSERSSSSGVRSISRNVAPHKLTPTDHLSWALIKTQLGQDAAGEFQL